MSDIMPRLGSSRHFFNCLGVYEIGLEGQISGGARRKEAWWLLSRSLLETRGRHMAGGIWGTTTPS